MTRRQQGFLIILTFWSSLVLAPNLPGQSNLVDNSFFRTGSYSFQNRDFATAAADFHTAWALLGNVAGVTERNIVAARLLECWYRNGDKPTAVRWYRGVETLELSNEVKKWVALSMLDTGYYEESAQMFEKLGNDAPRSVRSQMCVFQAVALSRIGASERAYRLLIPDFAQPTNASDAYFYARLAHQTNRWTEGIAYCETAAGFAGQAESFYAEVTQLKARCLAGAGHTLEAVTLLLDMIEGTYASKILHPGFDALLQIASAQEKILLSTRFNLWSNDSTFPDRQLAAQYYNILIDSNPNEEQLVERLETFITQNPKHPLSREALLMLGSISPSTALQFSGNENAEESIMLKRQINFNSAVKQFQEKSFDDAKDTFLEVSSQLEGRQRERALFNSAIASLYSGDDQTFASLEKDFAKDGNFASAMHADLLFLGGLFYASKANPQAFNLLTRFTQSYPEHTSFVDARLALAELYLNQVPAQPLAAREVFKTLENIELSPTRKERLNYAELWTELLTGDSPLVLEKATAFLVQWPYSKLRPAVSMLLASEFYNQRKYVEAKEAFLRVARDFPESNQKETALFFAAKTAQAAERTTPSVTDPDIDGHWDQIISQGGPLAHQARHEKSLNLIKLDRFDEAIQILDEIIQTTTTAASDLRIAAHCDKGYALYMKALALGKESKTLNLAADEFAEVVRDSHATRAWSYQASVRRGKCLELIGRENIALEIYQSLTLESEENPAPQIGSSPVDEYNWLYRAGFSAIEILEKKQDWAGAVQLAETLAQRSGPRASETQRRASRLRLKHFVWD